MDFKPCKLSNRIQHYAWGTQDRNAFIPKLLGMEPEPDTPYAELWIGAHPSAPSDVLMKGRTVPLNRWILHAPEQILGNTVRDQYRGQLPFLLKVLSAGQPLSIQAHPDRIQAVQLHAHDPGHYPDANHKPEIAIAIDSLTALAGFRPPDELVELLDRHPEIAAFISAKVPVFRSDPENNLRTLFSHMMLRSASRPDHLQNAIDHLAERLSSASGLTEPDILFLQLRNRYPGPDIGLFFLFFLNLVHLKPGEAVYLKAGMPHAYVRGNIVECMANSDNVVRAGLTSKFKDMNILTRILTYEQGRPETIRADGPDTLYSPPVPEFRIRRLGIKKGDAIAIRMEHGIQILLVLEGAVRISESDHFRCVRGDSFVLPAAIGQYTLAAEESALVFVAEPGIPVSRFQALPGNA